MAQLTISNPDGSIVDTFSISDALAVELSVVLEYSTKESLDLALLREIELKILSVFSKILKEKNIQINNVQEAKGFAMSSISYFTSLLDVISRVENLPNSDSLTIFVSN